MITSKNLVHHEFIGLRVQATSEKNSSLKLIGTIIDETKNTIKIEDANKNEKLIPKKGSIFLFEIPNGEKLKLMVIFCPFVLKIELKKDLKKFKW